MQSVGRERCCKAAKVIRLLREQAQIMKRWLKTSGCSPRMGLQTMGLYKGTEREGVLSLGSSPPYLFVLNAIKWSRENKGTLLSLATGMKRQLFLYHLTTHQWGWGGGLSW